MLSSDDLAARYQELPSDHLPGPEFFSRLKASETKIVQKCCLLLSQEEKSCLVYVNSRSYTCRSLRDDRAREGGRRDACGEAAGRFRKT